MKDDDRFYRETESTAFPKLDDYQLSLLQPMGQTRVVKRGDVVYKAGQESLERLVALKMIRAGSLAGPQERHRFRIEAESALAGY